MKRLLFVVGGILLMIGCETGSVSKKLADIDSLIVREEYDSAYRMVSSLNETTINNQDDLAYYYLMKVQTGYLVGKPIESPDSLLNEVIMFYLKNMDTEKLSNAYYYMAITSYYNRKLKESILYYKKAEVMADRSNNKREQFKIAEGLSFINGKASNTELQIEYAKKALLLARQIGNKNMVAYSLYQVGFAYSKRGILDSMLYYFSKIEPYIEDVKKKDLSKLLASIGISLKHQNPQKAKEFLNKSLSYQELTATYEHLADISYCEEKQDEYHDYLIKALTVDDATPKDNIIRNLIEYDIERGKTDSISDMVTRIIEIRDSIDAKLKDDTIKDLQTRFDHELALKEKDRVFVRGILIMTIVIFVLIGVFSVIYFRRRHLAKLQMLDYQMQINDNLRQIEIVKASGINTKQEVERLNKLIEDIMKNKAPKLDRGRMLYDDIINGNITMIDWNREHEQMFLDYYTATHYDTVKKMKNVRRVEKLTPHKLFYLILVKLGKTDEQIQQMMSVSDSTLRGLKHRTKPLV